MHIIPTLLLAAGLQAAPATAPDAPDTRQARQIAEQYIAGKQAAGGNPQESYQVDAVALADLDGDGRSEIIVTWTMLGPTYWNHGLSVLARQGRRYLPAGEAQEPLGSVQGMTVANRIIQLQSKWPGPNDPRCCPSVPKTLRYRWTPGKLSPVK